MHGCKQTDKIQIETILNSSTIDFFATVKFPILYVPLHLKYSTPKEFICPFRQKKNLPVQLGHNWIPGHTTEIYFHCFGGFPFHGQRNHLKHSYRHKRRHFYRKSSDLMKIGHMTRHLNGHMTLCHRKGIASKLSDDLRMVLAKTLSKTETENQFSAKTASDLRSVLAKTLSKTVLRQRDRKWDLV